jgi:hypothetical protein
LFGEARQFIIGWNASGIVSGIIVDDPGYKQIKSCFRRCIKKNRLLNGIP